jgi:hypothetical protein
MKRAFKPTTVALALPYPIFGKGSPAIRRGSEVKLKVY